ncbi:uncharacterized protein LOC117817857 isoform X2 [Notolabrus celidotus]|uniref:uncharacterized protein LOC117817857 isoform X2 n=1 Tax=Notolabrus celidotus TaxID=1203425 RepID=UPI001490486F|nr:uncharacterized protein LOC117817857 isoform X2 [Notolabrus celidotus]
MWCYQKPGYEALLLAELQRQQQCSQFCDTVLKTEGVSVPTHSCILSAISPQISSSLSSMSPPLAGRSHLLEFRALGASTLLQLVRLLYSGEMVGEGEEERQEAVSAAARLGIHGLVEVTKGRNEAAEGQHKEVGVQTEPLIPVENEERWGRWRREERDGDTFLWRETLSQGERDTWTQTEVKTAPPSHQAASFETIDMGALQTLGQTDPPIHQTQIPYIPVSLIYPPNGIQNQVNPCADPKTWWAGAAAEELEDERFEQFQGNIPGYISYFLNPHKEEGQRRGRPRGSRAARSRGARRAAAGGRGASRPQACSGGRARGRGRGGLTQTVDVQTVGVSKIQKMYLQRWGIRTPRAGQGGGAVGRGLYLKTRELLRQTKKCPRNRRKGKCGKEWEVSQSEDVREGEEEEGNLQQLWDGVPAQREKNKPTTSASFSSPSVRFYNAHHTLPASNPTLQPSPSPSLMSPVAPYQHPVSSLLHTTSLPPPNLPANEPEHIDRLLEEVMMGLDILPNKTKHQDRATVLLETGPRHVGGGSGSGGRGTSGSSGPVLQQQGEGELNDMLENFLQSFEQHVESAPTREEMEKEGPEDARSKYIKKRMDEAESLQSYLQRRRSSAVPQKPAEETATQVTAPRKRRKRRRKNEYPLSLEKKRVRVRVRKPVSSSEAKDQTIADRGDKQLLQMPVVKLERSGALPARVTLQGRSCQSLEECSTPTIRSSSLVKDLLKNWNTKVYPIRSRFREAHIKDSMPFLHEPDNHQPTTDNPTPRQSRPKKNRKRCSSSTMESSMSTVQQQQRPVDELEEENQENREEELNVQPNEAGGPRRTGEKRGAESDEETSSDITEAKRFCFEQPTLTTSSACAESAATHREEINSVDTNVVECLQNRELGDKLMWREDRLEEEEVDVDRDDEDDCHQTIRASTSVSPPSHSKEEAGLASTESCEEDIDKDIDVIGGSSPVPDPVVISWSDSLEGEEEEEEEEGDQDVDVVGEKMDYTPSALFTAMNEMVEPQC